ncbi:MAG: tRNA (guanosine(46)-N7)-methyltransferase TrmB [Hyphomicrobiales bacterium]|nr:tRNA (guanosine(46)-N7)-methyltransferase TrmB [Hyphomicrobiales bacterium]
MALAGSDDDEGDQPQRPTEERFYGRRKGRPLTPRRQKLLDDLLPKLRIDVSAPPPYGLASLFEAPITDIWLEIGFGGGEHLIAQARRRPDVGFIGAEPFLNGVAKVIAQVSAHNLMNVRVLDNDVRPLMAWLPDASLGRAFILFPDPWPKRRHDGRRIVSPDLIAQLERTLRPGAMLTIASDIEAYIRGVMSVMSEVPSFAAIERDILLRPRDWAVTRYEEKALAAGRACRYLEFIRL